MGLDLSEAAELASFVRRVARFLLEAVNAYAFFAFGMGVIGSIIVAGVLGALYGLNEGISTIIGVAVGIVLSIAAFYWVAGPTWRYLAKRGVKTSDSRAWLAFLGVGAAYAPSPLAPGWYPSVAWYPGLAVSLLLLYTVIHARSLLLAGILLAATTPLVLAAAPLGFGAALASGLLLLIYLIAGGYALREASRRLVEG